MDFGREMLDAVRRHQAVNNRFLDRFAAGKVTDEQLGTFAREFYHFSRQFPAILAKLLANTADEAEAEELTKILSSELGDGDPKKRHELMFRRFLRTLRIEPRDAITARMLPTTRSYLGGLERLYGGRDHIAALGASFALENMATPMWDKLVPGLERARARTPNLDIEFFTFHREIEHLHEEAMGETLGLQSEDSAIQGRFAAGALAALELLSAFWKGIERGGNTQAGARSRERGRGGRAGRRSRG